MKRIIVTLCLPYLLWAKLNVCVSYPYIGALTEEISQNRVDITVLAKGNWDPHFVVPRPSLIAKLRRGDALIINGAQLEIGWLPPLIRRAANTKISPNAQSFLNLSHQLELIQKPQSVDRSLGDVHPDGNPHFHLDPYNMIVLAQSIAGFLSRLDPDNAQMFEQNLHTFETKWSEHIKRWEARMADKKGMKVIQFHDNLAYFNKAFGITSIATIEPLPGIPPSSRHTLRLMQIIREQKPSYILHDVYHASSTAEYLVDKTDIKLVLMPHDIGALESVESLVGLFDYMTEAVHDD